MLLDVVTPGATISLGSGDGAMFVVAAIIFLIAALPHLFGGGGRR